MEKIKLTKKDEAALLRRFKSHNQIAKELGITYRRWCQIRDKREISKRIKIIMDMKVE